MSSNSEQYKLVKFIARHEEDLLPILSDEARETYEKLWECKSELSSLNELEAFISGFRLGAQIMLEVMEVSDNE